MGNCCGKTESDNFSQPGRILGSAPPQQPTTAPIPLKIGGPPRTLGGGGGDNSNSNHGGESQDDARKRAAEAAEARANAANKGGKLQSQLTAQKKQSLSNVLKEASEQNVKQREAEEAAQARQWS